MENGSTKVSSIKKIFGITAFKKMQIHEMEKFAQKEESASFKRLRSRAVRRRMVLAQCLLLLLTPVIAFFQDRSAEGASKVVFSLLFLVCVGGLYVLYFPLRTSVRLIADAPDEYLDERQIQIRNNTYLESYRIFAGVMAVVGLTLVALISAGASFKSHSTLATGVLVSLFMFMGILPTMNMAWKEEEI